MAQKFKRKLQAEGHDIKEAVDFTVRNGIFQGCIKYKAGYDAVRRFVIEETGDENAGRIPQYTRLTTTPGKTMVDEFFGRLEDCIKNRILKLEGKIAQQNEYIEHLELELNNYRDKQTDDIEAGLIKIAEVCRV